MAQSTKNEKVLPSSVAVSSGNGNNPVQSQPHRVNVDGSTNSNVNVSANVNTSANRGAVGSGSAAPMLIKQTMVSSCNYDDDNAAPLHLHALPIDQTLPSCASEASTSNTSNTSSTSNSSFPALVPTTTSQSSTSRSRSRSTSRSRSRAGSFSSSRSASPSSSVATPRILDPHDDILLDKLGLLELQQLQIQQNPTGTGIGTGTNSSDDLSFPIHTNNPAIHNSTITSSNSCSSNNNSSSSSNNNNNNNNASPTTSSSSSAAAALDLSHSSIHSHATTQPPQIQLQLQQQAQTHSSSSHHSSSINTIRKSTLHSVNERMSDESLDDVHAFTDLRNVVKQIKIPSKSDSHNNSNIHTINNINGTGINSINPNSGSNISLSSGASSATSGLSREGSVSGSYFDDGNFLLETLEEFDDENEEEDDDDDTTSNENKNEEVNKQDRNEGQGEIKKGSINVSSMTITEE